MTIKLTALEREQARQIWDLLQNDDDDDDDEFKGLQQLEAAPENVRVAIVEAAQINKNGSEPKENPFA